MGRTYISALHGGFTTLKKKKSFFIIYYSMVTNGRQIQEIRVVNELNLFSMAAVLSPSGSDNPKYVLNGSINTSKASKIDAQLLLNDGCDSTYCLFVIRLHHFNSMSDISSARFPIAMSPSIVHFGGFEPGKVHSVLLV